MKLKAILLIIAFGFLLVGSANPDTSKQHKGSLLLYTWYGAWIGSAWVVQTDPLRVVTAAHCVLDLESGVPTANVFSVKESGGKTEQIKLYFYDRIKDVAVLGLDTKSTLPVEAIPVATHILPDQKIWIYGAGEKVKPYTILRGAYLFRVKYENKAEPLMSREWYLTSINTVPGCSGAAVMNEDGQVVGIVWGHWINEQGVHYGLITPLDYLADVLRQAGLVIPLADVPEENKTITGGQFQHD